MFVPQLSVPEPKVSASVAKEVTVALRTMQPVLPRVHLGAVAGAAIRRQDLLVRLDPGDRPVAMGTRADSDIRDTMVSKEN